MSDERQNRPTFVGVVELPDKIGRQNQRTMTHDRFLSGDCVGRENRPILSFV